MVFFAENIQSHLPKPFANKQNVQQNAADCRKRKKAVDSGMRRNAKAGIASTKSISKAPEEGLREGKSGDSGTR